MLNHFNNPDYVTSSSNTLGASTVVSAVANGQLQVVAFSGSTSGGGLELKLAYGASTVYTNDVSGAAIISEHWDQNNSPIADKDQDITVTVTALSGSTNANVLYRIVF